MNPDVLLPVVAIVATLALVGSGLASYKLKPARAFGYVLIWIAVFGALFLITEWFLTARDTASVLL